MMEILEAEPARHGPTARRRGLTNTALTSFGTDSVAQVNHKRGTLTMVTSVRKLQHGETFEGDTEPSHIRSLQD
jgi:hypothetical protein